MFPIYGIDAAVNRVTSNYPNGFCPEQRITVERALRAYTTDAAWSMFAEEKVGTLKKGMLADITILNQNLFNVPAAQIQQTKVVMTIVGGKIQYLNQ